METLKNLFSVNAFLILFGAVTAYALLLNIGVMLVCKWKDIDKDNVTKESYTTSMGRVVRICALFATPLIVIQYLEAPIHVAILFGFMALVAVTLTYKWIMKALVIIIYYVAVFLVAVAQFIWYGFEDPDKKEEK